MYTSKQVSEAFTLYTFFSELLVLGLFVPIRPLSLATIGPLDNGPLGPPNFLSRGVWDHFFDRPLTRMLFGKLDELDEAFPKKLETSL